MLNAEMFKCLDDLTERLDSEQENANVESWMSFWRNDHGGELFYPLVREPVEPKVYWPRIYMNDALKDPSLMVLREFGMVSSALRKPEDVPYGSSCGNRLCVRANYGTGILPTVFGCDLFEMEYEFDQLPTAKPMHREGVIKELVDAGIPDINQRLGAGVFEAAEIFMEIFEKYPILKKHVELYHPDLQGPIDVAEVIWGSDIFYAFGDEPQLVHDFLDLITDTYIAFMKEWYKIVGTPKSDYTAHWGMVMKGDIALRNDSLMNLSPDIYVEFVRPRDQRIFDEFNGGVIHFCGRGDHYIAPMSEMRGLTAIQMSQPEYNNMETIYQNTVDKGIRLLCLQKQAGEAAIAAGRDLHGLVSV